MTASDRSRSASTGIDGQTFRGESLLVRYANFVKLPHTVFALPFALLGVIAASYEAPVTIAELGWVVVAFTSARFVAMGINRLADRAIDAENPRTKHRELPTGRLTPRQAWAAVAVAAALFVVAAAALNRLALVLSPLALAWISLYSLTKRWTSWSHLWLGLSLAIAPAGGYIAIAGTWSRPWHALLLIAGAVALWVAGFDILYALQDASFDRAHGLRSAVVRLGGRKAIVLAKVLHTLAVGGFAWYGYAADFGLIYLAGVGVAALVIAWEHRLVTPTDLARVDRAFFTMNGVVSIVIFLGALGDRLA